MELTYKVRGVDGKEYGPVSLEQLSAWYKEGRVHAQTEVKRSDVNYWSVASEYQELQPTVAPAEAPPSPATATSNVGNNPALLSQMRSGASWFYWVAGLSLINSIAALSGGTFKFFFGLGITHEIDRRFSAGASGGIVAFVLNFIVAGMFVIFGVFGNKGQLWAFIVGLILFALDTLLFLLGSDWLGLALHVVVIFFLFRGLAACRSLNQT